MSFDALENSRYRGKPATLYLFIYGGSAGDSPPPNYFGYTDAEQQIVYGGFTYEPLPVMRDNVVSSGTLDRSALTIRMPRDAEISEEFRVYPPAQVMSLIIRQGHLGDSPLEFLVVWSGNVLSVGREGSECVLSCEPISSSLRRPGLRRHYQFGCPHVLYGAACKADKTTKTVSTTVSSTSNTSVTLPGGWNGSIDAAKFVEGFAEWTNDAGGLEKRKVLSVTGNVLLLGGLLRDLTDGHAINVIAGCNHLMSDCGGFHTNSVGGGSNIQNFGGCPWIPLNNPVGYGLNQYY